MSSDNRPFDDSDYTAQHMTETVMLAFELLRKSKGMNFQGVSQIPMVFMTATGMITKMLAPHVSAKQFGTLCSVNMELVEAVIGSSIELQELIANYHLMLHGMTDEENKG